jgi:hypothetical protein
VLAKMAEPGVPKLADLSTAAARDWLKAFAAARLER